ncbi:AfsR/SARP family transcriptional regulator [Kribbella sp. CA-294648]|uniref:AfsR/SARP family transcriptional regulator n=1 Tax=Kribbella sp. CA-294648 TaxID=3239948 RepID=UPI003D904568
MDYRLLGPVEVWASGRKVELKRRQERLLLAVLLLEPGKIVSTDRLIGLLWPEEQPGNPKRALQVYVSRLRSVLTTEDPKAQLTGGAQGYALQGAGGRTDVEKFVALVDRARGLPDLEQRRELLVEALALWRGPALADVASEDVRRRLCGGLDESRWAALELRLTTDLALGRHQELLPELAQLTSGEPTREGLAAARMLALYRSGRQAEALAAYAELARHLDEDLGIEPGPAVRELQVAILRHDESLSLSAHSAGPRELPADVGLLVGRDELLAELSGVLTRAGRQSGVPVVVCLYGGAGTASRQLRSVWGIGSLSSTRTGRSSSACRMSMGRPYRPGPSSGGCCGRWVSTGRRSLIHWKNGRHCSAVRWQGELSSWSSTTYWTQAS